MKHTTGPWVLKSIPGHLFEVNDGKNPVLRIRGGTMPTLADARLIAAAPTLLTVAEIAYTILGDNRHQWEGRHTAEGQGALNALRDAIAAATGREAREVQDDYCNRNTALPDTCACGHVLDAQDIDGGRCTSCGTMLLPKT